MLILGNISLSGNPKAIEFLRQFLPRIQHLTSAEPTEQVIDGLPGSRSTPELEPEMRHVSEVYSLYHLVPLKTLL